MYLDILFTYTNNGDRDGRKTNIDFNSFYFIICIIKTTIQPKIKQEIFLLFSR